MEVVINLFDSLYDFLTKKELKAIDVIVITVVSSFLFTYGNKFIISTVKYIGKRSSKLYYRCRLTLSNWNRVLKGKELTMYHYEKVKERLDNGGKLKCYEKRSYIKSRRSHRRAIRNFRNWSKDINVSPNVEVLKDNFKK